jgi:large subunit ribosomal protein L3
MWVCAVRTYFESNQGLKTLTEAWMKNPPKDLLHVKNFASNNGLKKIEDNLNKISEFRVLCATQPRQTGISKKKPDMMEIKIDGGSREEKFEYLKNKLGKTMSINEVFKEGQMADVVSITKGKGFQGPVKRWGVKILPRKSRKTKRGVAVIGPWNPSRVLYSVPRPGQMGYFQRTEYNKRILKIGTDGNEVSPAGGFLRYGPIRGPYVIMDGSIPGPTKRLIRLRYPVRPPKEMPENPPRITEISLKSLQG